MNIRTLLLWRVLWTGCLLCAALHGLAQNRVFPENGRLGVLQITTAPEVLLDGAAARLAPGSLIRNLQNMIITPNELNGRFVVLYTRDTLGDILFVWILSEQEFQRERARPRS